MDDKKLRRRSPSAMFKLFLRAAFAGFTIIFVVLVIDGSNIDDFRTNLATEIVGIAVTYWIVDRMRDRSDSAFKEAAGEIKAQFHAETTRLIKQLEDESQATLTYLAEQQKAFEDTIARRRDLITQEIEQIVADEEDETETPTEHPDESAFDPPTNFTPVCNFAEAERLKNIHRDVHRVHKSIKLLAKRLPSGDT